MKYEVKNIHIGSLIFSSLPIVIFALGFLGAITAFFMVPTPIVGGMSLGKKALAVGMYSFLYMFLALALFVFLAFVYNFFTAVLGLSGIKVDLEEEE